MMDGKALDNVASLAWFAPELAVTAALLLVVLADLVPSLRAGRAAPAFAAIGLACALLAVFFYYVEFAVARHGGGGAAGGGLPHLQQILSGELGGATPPVDIFAGAEGVGRNRFGLLRVDPFALFFKMLILVSLLLVVGFSWHHRGIRRYGDGEYYALLLASALGLLLMASATDLLMVYLSIEMVSLPSYALSGFFRRDRKSSEAGLKYVLYGAVASAVMIYGLSLLYGLTGTLSLQEIPSRLRGTLSFAPGLLGQTPALSLATLFILGGFAFKIAAFPFHTWCPDVYEGAPTPVTAFLSVAPKVAGFAVMLRFLSMAFPDPAARDAVNPNWPAFLTVAAVLTMTWGNLAALGQTNVKRLLAYSAIAHAGYLLMGVVTVSSGMADAPREQGEAVIRVGREAVLFYLVAYAFMDLGAFFAVIVIADRLGVEDLDGYRGLGWRAPAVAAAMTIFLLSLIGLPPMVGFVGKLLLFKAVIEARLFWLAVVGVLNSVISLYYYVKVIRAMYLEGVPADGQTVPALPVPKFATFLLYAMAVPTVWLGVSFGRLYELVRYSLTGIAY
ncbi:MAG: NADH-quinone oxidoreductase subunit N [Planctomycetes bacterium]|nr:NADH-quinone oxidoreductase subunit N [Planctomycetota bacterium]